MKASFTLLFAFLLTTSYAQTRQTTGPVTTKHGIVIEVGDKLRMGEGSLPSGGYRYVYKSPAAFGKGHLDGGFQYVTAEIREIQERGTGAGRTLVLLIVPKGDLNIFKKAVDIERAIDAREIIAVNGVSISKLIAKKKAGIARN